MECSSCEKSINDDSKFCPHCGAEQEIPFCNACGTAVGAKSSRKGGMVLLILLVLSIALLFWKGNSSGVEFNVDPGTPNKISLLEKGKKSSAFTEKVKLIFKNSDEKDYEILSSSIIDFGGNKIKETYLLVKEGESKNKQVEFAKREIRSGDDIGTEDVAVLYVCANSECRELGTYLAEFVSVNMELNPDYHLDESFSPLNDSLFFKWNDIDA